MFQEFQGIGKKYLINVDLITFVIDNGSIRTIMTAFDDIEVINTLEEIQEIIKRHYKRKSASVFN